MCIYFKRANLDLGQYQYITKIPGSKSWVSATLVGGGWSSDIKFHIVTKTDGEFLLRVSAASERAKKLAEYEALKKLKKTGINYPTPFSFGELHDAQKVYMLLKWVDGHNVEEAMPYYDSKKKYEFGKKAGIILRKMHTLPSPLTVDEWKNKNIDYINARNSIYQQSGVYIDGYDIFYDFVMSNMSLLNDRPVSFHHGDYQGRNIIISSNDDVGVIDL